jgi:hypothetical protein
MRADRTWRRQHLRAHMSLGADVRVADLDAAPLKAPATIPSPTTGTWIPAGASVAWTRHALCVARVSK